MTVPGQLKAKAPASPHINLQATVRYGTTSWGSATWLVSCTCGATIKANAPAIKAGMTRCATCNPSATVKQIAAVLAVLPGTYEQIERKAKLSAGKVRYSLDLMRADGKCFVGDWDRSTEQGGYSPVFHAGTGKDVPCTLEPIPRKRSERKYKRRIKAAIARALQGGKEDPRYIKHISLHVAKLTAAKTRVQPATWFAALPGGQL